MEMETEELTTSSFFLDINITLNVDLLKYFHNVNRK